MMGRKPKSDARWKRDPDTGCFEWQRGLSSGYGWDSADGGEYAHRRQWEKHFGPIPEGMCVLHSCDNPPCGEPTHLFLGSKKDNTQDMLSKGRNDNGRGRETHCVNGHEFTPGNTLISKRGWRRCRICKNEQNRIYMQTYVRK